MKETKALCALTDSVQTSRNFPNQGPTPQRRKYTGVHKGLMKCEKFLSCHLIPVGNSLARCAADRTKQRIAWPLAEDFIIEAETEWAMCMFRTVIALWIITEVPLVSHTNI